MKTDENVIEQSEEPPQFSKNRIGTWRRSRPWGAVCSRVPWAKGHPRVVVSLKVMPPSCDFSPPERHSRLTFTLNITSWAESRTAEVPGGHGNRIYTESAEEN